MTPPPNMREVHLGTMKLSRVNAAAGHAKVLQVSRNHSNRLDVC